MPNIMIDTKLNRVDLVDEGSCSEAYIMLFKGKDGKGMNKKEMVDAILAKMKPEYRDAVNEYLSEEVAKAKEEAKPAEDDKTKEELEKAKEDLDTANTELAKAKEDLATANSKIEDLEKSIETEVNKSKGEPDFEEVLKSAPEAMRGFLTQMKKQNDELVAKAKEAEEQKVEAEAVAKAKDLAALPVEQAKLVEVIKSAPEALLEVLSTVAKSIEESDLFKEKGSNKAENLSDANAIDAKAEVLAKSKNITKEKALMEIFKENPDLYTKYNGGAK